MTSQGDEEAPCPEKRPVVVVVGAKPQPPHIRIPPRNQGLFITLLVLAADQADRRIRPARLPGQSGALTGLWTATGNGCLHASRASPSPASGPGEQTYTRGNDHPLPKAQPGPALAVIVDDRRGQQVRMPLPPAPRLRRPGAPASRGGTRNCTGRWATPMSLLLPSLQNRLKAAESGNLDGDSPKPRGWAITGDGLAAAPVRARRPAGTAHARQVPQPESPARSVHPASPGTGDRSG